MTKSTSKKSVPKIVLSGSRDIPFNKLVLSQSNVRKVKTGVSIEDLAEDIARRTLLQSLNVRAQLNSDGTETGLYEVPAGGRRFRALELLVKQKRMARDQLVPCIVREGGMAEEDSLAENAHREALHPVDQFRAFQTLIDNGLSEEEIAARFFVTPVTVRQRLKLAAVSPLIINLYLAEDLTLEQVMAFTLTDDHLRQEQVLAAFQQGWNKAPHVIRRMLTEAAVPGDDARARFVGIDAYIAAGGVVTRDLFEDDSGGWLQDPALLDRLADEKLAREADALAKAGWKWVTAALEFPYGHTRGLRRLVGVECELSAEEAAQRATLVDEFDRLQAEYEDADELPDEIDARFGELEQAIEAIDDRPMQYDLAEMAKAGVFLSIDSDGDLQFDRGYVRPGDEEQTSEGGNDTDGDAVGSQTGNVSVITGEGAKGQDRGNAAGPRLPDRLVTELTGYRTLALRDALARSPDIAYASVLHALCLDAFYMQRGESCLEISARSAALPSQAPGLAESAPALALKARHEAWQAQLPEDVAELWDWLLTLDSEAKSNLLAHAASLSVNALVEPQNQRSRALAHSHALARATGLDLVAAGWQPTVENYLGRVQKAHILEAVREGRDRRSASLIDHLKKNVMAQEAERLLKDSGWLPEPLRAEQSLGMSAEEDSARSGDDLADDVDDGVEVAEAA